MTSAAPPTVRRVFLGGDGPPLAAAAEWLREELGTDATGAVVALPGARAARHLRLRLARLVGDRWLPPRFVTAGGLTDVLLDLAGAPADRLVRTLAWRRALAGLPPTELHRLAARPPEAGDLTGWVRLAEEVRGLFGELAAEGLDFRAVAESENFPEEGPGERRRWETLAAAQELVLAELADAGCVDPHQARLEAIRAGRASDVSRVVLVGVADTNDLLRQALEVTTAEVTALVFAPEQEAPLFDELGRIRPTGWIERELELPLDHWHVVETPDDQAACALTVVADWSEQLPSDELAIGIADPDVVPHLKRRLAAIGAVGRDAAGVAFARTPPARLLAAAAAALESGGFLELQDLGRHPAVDHVLARACTADPVELLARYQREHLPDGVPAQWVAKAHGLADLRRLGSALGELLGELENTDRRSLTKWVPCLRAFLLRAYGDDARADRGVLEALGVLAGALEALAVLPPALDTHATAAQALWLLGKAAGGASIPPAPSQSGEATVELLGWLELPLDDAPALVVTGFEEGRVPESQSGDTYLPNRLRRDLGLIDDERRLARDLYTTALLLRTRRNVAFVSGRRAQSGDPQLPSRVVFHAGEEAVLARVKRFLQAGEQNPTRTSAEVDPARALLRAAEQPAPTSFSVTSFADYLESPYLFYLRDVLRLRSYDDRARELDPLNFGNLAHHVLEGLGDVPDELDAEKLSRFLEGRLRKRVDEVCGDGVLPAVMLQVEQLSARLERFAQVEARHREAGWRIHAVELAFEDHAFDVDGAPVMLRGRIDRVERNDRDGSWAVWDVKSSDSARPPGTAHRSKAGLWRDLQLPLYALLVHEITGEKPPTLGYANLSKSADKAFGFQPVKSWGSGKEALELEEGIASAVEQAQDIVRAVRKGDLFKLGNWRSREAILRELAGKELVGTEEAEGEAAEDSE